MAEDSAVAVLVEEAVDLAGLAVVHSAVAAPAAVGDDPARVIFLEPAPWAG